MRESLLSVINQTVSPTEIILVVDGPISQELGSIITDFKKKNECLKTIWLKENVGLGNARRIGLRNCNYELIAIMDSDDISQPGRFEKQLRCFEEDKDLSVVGGYICEFIGNINSVVGVRTVPLSDNEIKLYLKSRCPFNHMTVMFRKSAVLEAGGYLDWYFNEDYYLWIRMYQSGAKFKNLINNLVNVRVGSDMYHRRGGWGYFKSEVKLQGYMLKQGIIGFGQYIFNVILRFLVQVLIPSEVRGVIFRKFFRKQNE